MCVIGSQAGVWYAYVGARTMHAHTLLIERVGECARVMGVNIRELKGLRVGERARQMDCKRVGQ